MKGKILFPSSWRISFPGLFPFRIRPKLRILQTVRRALLAEKSAHHKGCTCKGQYRHRKQADIQPWFEWDSNQRSQCLSENISCLRPRGLCHRRKEYLIVIVYFQFLNIYFYATYVPDKFWTEVGYHIVAHDVWKCVCLFKINGGE
jgi:hypothetical protein